MVKLNRHYSELKSSYLFYNIAQKVKKYSAENPDKHILRLGIGDVTQPLCPEVVNALHKAADDQSVKATFRGYMPECGTDFFRKAVQGYYAKRNVMLDDDEVFVSSGASDELGDILDLFEEDNDAMIMEPAYPAYVDANIIAGHGIVHVPTSEEGGFVACPDYDKKADIIYICSPNNPTGAVYSKELLGEWVKYANETGAVIIFDAAYESFIQDPEIPHSIFEVEGSRTCAIEICSLSKTAGFTGTRCGYTVIPKSLERGGMNIHDMWVRNRTTKTNGVSYILQRAGAAVFTEEGQKGVQKTLEIYRNNAQILMKALDKCGIMYCGGKNAPYIWLKCPNGMDSWTLFDYLLEKAQVVGTPGEGFGECGKYYFRLTSFGDPAETEMAAERIVALFGK